MANVSGKSFLVSALILVGHILGRQGVDGNLREELKFGLCSLVVAITIRPDSERNYLVALSLEFIKRLPEICPRRNC